MKKTTDITPRDPEGSASSALAMLMDLRGGVTLSELDEQLSKLVNAVCDTGKKGELTLKLLVRPAGSSDTRALILEDQVKVKLPELARGSSIFFADERSRLTRQDPRQMQLDDVKEVPQDLPTVNGRLLREVK